MAHSQGVEVEDVAESGGLNSEFAVYNNFQFADYKSLLGSDLDRL